MKSGDLELTLVVLALAVGLALALIVLLRRVWQVDRNDPQVRVGGVYSPILTWLKYRRLPRGHLDLSHSPVTAPAPFAAPAAASAAAPAQAVKAASGAGLRSVRQPAELRQPANDFPELTETLDRPIDALSLGLGIALILAVTGQALLLTTPDQPRLGLLTYAAAAVVLVAVARKVGTARAPSRFAAVPLPHQPPALALWLTCLLLWLYVVTQVNHGDLAPAEQYLVDAAWLASVALYSWCVLRLAHWQWPGWAALRSWAWALRREAAAVAFLALLALAVRTYDLAWHPYAFVNDEGEVGKAALEILHGLHPNLFASGWSGQPLWSFVPTAISVALLGHTAVAARLVSAVEGTLAVVFVYLFARDAFDRKTAFLAGAVLLGLAWHIHFSRLAVSNIIDSFFAAGVLWLVYRALKRGHVVDYLWAGLAAGLTVYTYLGSRLVLALAAAFLAYVLIRQRDYFRTHYVHLLVFAGAVLVVAGPELVYFSRHIDEFMGRLNSEGILVNGWLARQSAATGHSQASLLLDQFSHSTLVFVAASAPASFFNSPRPYLTALIAVFFVFGMVVAAWRVLQARHMLILVWFWSAVILGSTLTIGPPSNQRLLMAAPAAALLVAIGLREVGRLAARLRLASPGLIWMLAVGVVCIGSAQNTVFYFGQYRAGHYFEDPSNDFSYEVALYEETLGPGYRTYLLGDPSVYSYFADFAYLAPDVQGVDFNTVTPATFASLPRDKGAFFAAVPARLSDLRQVQQWAPGGAWREVRRRYQPGQWAYYAYVVPPQVFTKP